MPRQAHVYFEVVKIKTLEIKMSGAPLDSLYIKSRKELIRLSRPDQHPMIQRLSCQNTTLSFIFETGENICYSSECCFPLRKIPVVDVVA